MNPTHVQLSDRIAMTLQLVSLGKNLTNNNWYISQGNLSAYLLCRLVQILRQHVGR